MRKRRAVAIAALAISAAGCTPHPPVPHDAGRTRETDPGTYRERRVPAAAEVQVAGLYAGGRAVARTGATAPAPHWGTRSLPAFAR